MPNINGYIPVDITGRELQVGDYFLSGYAGSQRGLSINIVVKFTATNVMIRCLPVEYIKWSADQTIHYLKQLDVDTLEGHYTYTGWFPHSQAKNYCTIIDRATVDRIIKEHTPT